MGNLSINESILMFDPSLVNEVNLSKMDSNLI